MFNPIIYSSDVKASIEYTEQGFFYAGFKGEGDLFNNLEEAQGYLFNLCGADFDEDDVNEFLEEVEALKE